MISKKINIAVIGLGQVGNYLLNELNNKKKDIELKTGKKIKIVAISAKNKNKKRRFKIDKTIFYSDPIKMIKETKPNVVFDIVLVILAFVSILNDGPRIINMRKKLPLPFFVH